MEHVPVRIGPLSKIAIRKEKSIRERERERGGGWEREEVSLLWKRPFQFSAGTSVACQRVMHVVAFYPRTPWNVYRFFSRLFLESICVRGLCVERLSTSSKISGRRMCCRPITEIDSFVRKNDTKMDESNASSNQLPIFFLVLHPFQQRTVVTCYCFSKFECDLNLIWT